MCHTNGKSFLHQPVLFSASGVLPYPLMRVVNHSFPLRRFSDSYTRTLPDTRHGYADVEHATPPRGLAGGSSHGHHGRHQPCPAQACQRPRHQHQPGAGSPKGARMAAVEDSSPARAPQPPCGDAHVLPCEMPKRCGLPDLPLLLQSPAPRPPRSLSPPASLPTVGAADEHAMAEPVQNSKLQSTLETMVYTH